MNQDQVMALAAMCQAATLVQKIAHYGQCNEFELDVMLKSLTVTDPETPEAVYQQRKNLHTGYQALVQQLSSGPQKSVELVKYVGGMIQLERPLVGSPRRLEELGRGIDDIKRRLNHFSVADDTIIASFADLYSSLISPLGHRIQVFGKPDLLKQPHIQNKIRALLLAGIRSAVLWRQLGGKRRHFFFSKRKILAIAKSNL